MGRIFISYSSLDRGFVLDLAKKLQQLNHDIWLDRWSITGQNPSFYNEIQAGIDSCTHFLFVISPNSLDENGGALKELYYAFSLKPPPTLVLIVAPGAALDYKRLPMIISSSRYQIHDFTKAAFDVMLDRVITAVEPALSATPATRTKVVVELFTEDDIPKLGDLVKRSGRASSPPARRALCQEIGIDPDDYDLIDAAGRDFSINLVALVYRTGNFPGLLKLCNAIESALHGSYLVQLKANCRRISNSY